MTPYDFFKNASMDDIADFLASFGSTCVYRSVGVAIDGDNVKNTAVCKDLYKQYRELLQKEI